MADEEKNVEALEEGEQKDKKELLPKTPPPPNADAPWLGTGTTSWADRTMKKPSMPPMPGTK